MSDEARVGGDAKLYYAVGGVDGSFAELHNVVDVSLSDSFTEIKRLVRGQRLVQYEPGKQELSLEFTIIADPDDVGYQAIRAAYEGGLKIGLKALDAVDGDGPDFDAKIMQMNREEPVEDELKYNVVAKPCIGSTRHWNNPS